MAAAVGSLVPMAMGSALRMDPEETKYLACPTIADDSLAYEDTDVSQGGRKSATASGRLRGKFGGSFGDTFRQFALPLLATDDCFLPQQSETRAAAVDVLFSFSLREPVVGQRI